MRHSKIEQRRTVASGRLQIRKRLRGRADRLLIVLYDGVGDGKQRRLIAEVPSPGADLLLPLAAMHLTFFHVNPKRYEQPKRKPKTKNHSREDQPASPFVSEKGRDGGHNADHQE